MKAHSVSDMIPTTALSLPSLALSPSRVYSKGKGEQATLKTPRVQLLRKQWHGVQNNQSEIRIKDTTGNRGECIWGCGPVNQHGWGS